MFGLLLSWQQSIKVEVCFFSPSLPIRSDVGIAENCAGPGATSIRNAIRTDATRIIDEQIKGRLNRILASKYLGQTERYPATSCREILDSFPDSESGDYYINNTNGMVFRAYCNMELRCGPNVTGWMRVANVDLSDLDQTCPSGNFRLVTGPNRYCIRDFNNAGCDSTTFTARQVSYTQVCGRATGLQIGTVNGFLTANPTASLDATYVDGISLTYGTPRTHIWTFAAAMSEVVATCPCSSSSSNRSPQYVGNNYFCESAATTNTVGNTVFPRDNLWDGEMCRSLEMPCCSGNFNPPWFYRDFSNSLTADIDMRLCVNEGGDEDVGLKALEIYVQ